MARQLPKRAVPLDSHWLTDQESNCLLPWKANSLSSQNSHFPIILKTTCIMLVGLFIFIYFGVGNTQGHSAWWCIEYGVLGATKSRPSLPWKCGRRVQFKTCASQVSGPVLWVVSLVPWLAHFQRRYEVNSNGFFFLIMVSKAAYQRWLIFRFCFWF